MAVGSVSVVGAWMATTPDPPVAEVAIMVALTYAAAVAVILAYPPARKWVEKFWRDLKAILTFFGAPVQPSASAKPYTEPPEPKCAHKYTPVHSSDGAEILAYLCTRCGDSHYAEPVSESENETWQPFRKAAREQEAVFEAEVQRHLRNVQREAAAQRAWNTAQRRLWKQQQAEAGRQADREAAKRAWEEYRADKAAREAEKARKAAQSDTEQ